MCVHGGEGLIDRSKKFMNYLRALFPVPEYTCAGGPESRQHLCGRLFGLGRSSETLIKAQASLGRGGGSGTRSPLPRVPG